MATLTYQQIVQVARTGGLPGDPEVWAAIAMAESSGRTDVVNSIGCVGLWQINQPVWVKTHPSWTVAHLKNPVNNARAAAVVYHAQGFKAWEGYTGPSGAGSTGTWRTYYQSDSTNKVQPANWWNDFWKGFKSGEDVGPGPEDLWDGGTGNDPSLDSATQGLGDVATGVGAIAEAVQKASVWLGSSKNWVRVGYVVGGGVLVLLGLTIVARPLIAGTPVARAATTARKAVKAQRQSRAAKKEEEDGDE